MADSKVTHIGKYNVVEMIGRGGMGMVYKATDPQLDRMVAIKMMRAEFARDPELLKRFYREAQSTASLRHPNIVTVYDVGDQDGEPYLVMEFLDGESLEAIIASKRNLTLLDKISYIQQVCCGLQYAHARHVIHRDIKPANIMVLREGSIKIVDFGIARITGAEHVTQPGKVMGSIHYMAPEQIQGTDVDARTDLFATGVMLYQLLTCSLPFKGEDVSATLFKILHEPPLPLSRHLKSYPLDLDAIIERALAKKITERYQLAEELSFDLSQIQLQLEAGLVTELLQRANVSIEQGQLTHAREHLLELLRLDPQNQTANERMRTLQKLIQERRRAEQVQHFRKEAEEAVQKQDFDQALRFIERAIGLDPTNPELVSVRDNFNQAKARFDFIQDCMNRAHSMFSSGDPDQALKSLDELLSREPEYAPALALREEVSRELIKRKKRRQVQELLGKARDHLASQQFVEALEVLHQMAALDPNVPYLPSLLQLANKGIEKARRLQVLTSEIERLLERSDYIAAHERIESGLRDFPDEATLLKLRAACDRTRHVAEQRTDMNQRLGDARSLLNSGKSAQALAALQAVSDLIDKVPPDLQPRFDDLKALINEYCSEANASGNTTQSGLGAWDAEPETHSRLRSPSLEVTTTKDVRSPYSPHAAHRTTPDDKTLLELTPPVGQDLLGDLRRHVISGERPVSPATPPGESTSTRSVSPGNLSALHPELLARVEKQLAAFLGPLARILVNKSASKTNNTDELYTLLATYLERESDRIAFLAGKPRLTQNWTAEQPSQQPWPTSTIAPASGVTLKQADIDHAAQLLARHLGPIAVVLAKRAAQRADSLRSLYALLAEHVENKAERELFLRVSGYPNL